MTSARHEQPLPLDIPRTEDRLSLCNDAKHTYLFSPPNTDSPDLILTAKGGTQLDPDRDVELQNLDRTCAEVEKEYASTPADGLLGDKEREKWAQSSTTHPLFPPLPSYGPPSPLFSLQCLVIRSVSFVLYMSKNM